MSSDAAESVTRKYPATPPQCISAGRQSASQSGGVWQRELAGNTIPYTITATDNANNVATSSAASSILFYDGAPTLSTVTIASTTNPSPTWARNGDTVRVSFQVVRDLASVPSVNIAGHPAAVSPATTSAHSYTADYTYPPSDTTDIEGTVPFTISFTDAAGNVGTPVSTITSGSNVTYDRTPPTGYSAAIDQPYVYSGNQTAISFTFAGAEIGAGYSYTISSTGGGTPKNGSGTISTGTDTVSSIDVHLVADGTLTLRVTLTDAAGNTGSPSDSTKTKDATPPSGYAATITSAYVNIANASSVPMSFSGAEVGASYSYSISSTGGGTPVTGTGTVATPTDSFTPDLHLLGDGTLTARLTLTDVAGNAGSPVDTTKAKDTTPPSISTAPGSINFPDSTSMKVTFTEATYRNGSQGALQGGSISSIVDQTKLPADVHATVSGNPTTPDSITFTYTISWSGTPDTGDTILVTLTTVYDAAGNSATGGTGTGSRAILMFGATAQKAASVLRTVSDWVGGVFGSTQQATPPAAPANAARVLPATTATDAQAPVAARPTPREQFYAPLPAASATVPAGPAARAAAPAAAPAAVPAPGADQVQSSQMASVPTAAVSAAGAAPRAPAALHGVPAVTASSAPASAVRGSPELSSPAGSSWWVVALGIIAMGLATAGAWMFLRFVRGRSGK